MKPANRKIIDEIQGDISRFVSDRKISTEECLEMIEEISVYVEGIADGLKEDLSAQKATE